MNASCQLFGLSRQAYYKRKQVKQINHQRYAQVLDLVTAKRIRMSKIGGRKLHGLLADEFENYNLKVGRDKLFSILRANNMLVKTKKSYHKTTDSKHWLKKHKNMIMSMEITKPEQVWVADITYIPTTEGHNYLSLITDAYSKQIMGYHLSEDLRTEGPLKALQMAVGNRRYKGEIIHHSDRGLQYCSAEYQNLLAENGIIPSMTESYDPYQNAIAERVNGILKDEFNLTLGLKNHLQAIEVIKESISIYNQERPHLSCWMLTPNQMHLQSSLIPKKWKKKTSKTSALEVQNLTLN